MPRVVVTQIIYVHTNEEALALARETRRLGKGSEIITDDEYTEKYLMRQSQDLHAWAKENNVDYIPSS